MACSSTLPRRRVAGRGAVGLSVVVVAVSVLQMRGRGPLGCLSTPVEIRVYLKKLLMGLVFSEFKRYCVSYLRREEA